MAEKDILGIVLPVISAWAGTVLAFYFSRENYESAARNTAALVKQLTPEEKLRSTSVKDAMKPIDKAVTFQLNKPDDSVLIKSEIIDGKYEPSNVERLPILDAKGCIKYMAHRSMVDRFIVKSIPKKKPVEDLTLGDMVCDDYFKLILTDGFKTLPQTASLSEAKALMDKNKNCDDVFITMNGEKDTKVIGWVTNVCILEALKA
jgi:hypothetical protein